VPCLVDRGKGALPADDAHGMDGCKRRGELPGDAHGIGDGEGPSLLAQALQAKRFRVVGS
jgi:hypothetical protein